MNNQSINQSINQLTTIITSATARQGNVLVSCLSIWQHDNSENHGCIFTKYGE